MSEQKKTSLNRLLPQLGLGRLVDTAWLQDQGVSRPSIHAYVQNGWLERVAPRVYRRPSGATPATQRWDAAILSAQELRPSTFYVGGASALDLLGRSHYLRLGGHPTIYMYDPDRTAPTWLMKLPLDAALVVRTRPLFADTLLGLEWRRLELGTGRLGASVPEPVREEPWDHFLRVAGEERAAIEMLDEVPATLGFEHADEIFQGLSNLRPRLVTQLLETCRSVRAKRLFLFYADRHAHAWVKHVDRGHIDLGKGKRQLAPGGRLDARYQITIPASLSSHIELGER
ncbi:MAG: type IV toxin-antitoxin system AbiEi family antitoxin domain-containing protein [Novosphingobium sp.]|nr:type IV toxin-antitoxin system AbiEi family antitoxin domain-containing protein [Novosphingobium sp.]